MDQELENALKLYLIGKKRINDNNPKSLAYLKKSIQNINLIKKNFKDISDEKLNIINMTEADCKKILGNYENVFELITRNNLNSIKKISSFNFREINENGDTILHHCINVGDTFILKELLKRGGCIDQVNGNGNTLLEYACLKKDPNIINFLISHGANLKKHLFFRKSDIHYYLNKSDIDCAILLRVIINNSKDNNKFESFSFLKDYFSLNELIGLEKYTIKDLCIGLTNMFKNKHSLNTYKNIIIEDLKLFKSNGNLKKNFNKIDIVLFNLIPFISYPFQNVCNSYIIKNELKYLVKKILKDTDKSNDLRELLLNNLFDIYIKNDLYPKDYIGILIYQILNKFNKIKYI